MHIRLKAGDHPSQAVSKTVKYLLVPLTASTLTTVIAWSCQLQLLRAEPESSSERFGTTVIFGLIVFAGSLLLTVVGLLLMGLVHPPLARTKTTTPRWWKDGFLQ